MCLTLLISILISFSSCTEKEQIIRYKYDEVIITRVNKSKRTFFYYGDVNNQKMASTRTSIIVDWAFDDILFGFLLFHKNGTVEIIDGGGGNFQTQKGDNNIFTKKYDNSEFLKLLNHYRAPHMYDNLFQISNNLDLEKARNMEFGSKVSIIQEKR